MKQGQILTSVILLELVLGNFHIFLRIDGFNFSHKVVRTNFVFFKIKFLFMKTIQIMKKIIKKISVNFEVIDSKYFLKLSFPMIPTN